MRIWKIQRLFSEFKRVDMNWRNIGAVVGVFAGCSACVTQQPPPPTTNLAIDRTAFSNEALWAELSTTSYLPTIVAVEAELVLRGRRHLVPNSLDATVVGWLEPRLTLEMRLRSLIVDALILRLRQRLNGSFWSLVDRRSTNMA